jgi:uncharacterized protein (TIRG00374 family)
MYRSAGSFQKVCMETDLKTTSAGEQGIPWRRIFSVALRIVVGAIILYVVISLVQWENIVQALRTADLHFIILAALLLFCNIGVRTLKWRSMLRAVKDDPTLTEAFGSVMLGISLGSFTPGEIGEFAGRALHIADAKRSHLVGLALLDKAQIFLLTSCAGLVSLLWFTFDTVFIRFGLSLILVILFYFCILRLGIIAKAGHRFNSSFFQKPWLKNVFDGFNLLSRKQVMTTTSLTLGYHTVLILQMFCLLNAFSDISLLHVFFGMSALLFVKSLVPISIGDLGIREAGSIYFFSFYGISQAAALNASMILFFINILIPSIIGTYFIRYQRISNLQFWKSPVQESHD